MKKYLLVIIVFVVGLLLMSVGIILQLNAISKVSTNTYNNRITNSDVREVIELQDISTFDFEDVSTLVLAGQAGGFLVFCNNEIKTPVLVNNASMIGLLDNVKKSIGYRESNKTISSCPRTSFIIGVFNGTDISSKMLEIEVYDGETLLIVKNDVTYEFLYDEEISTLFNNLS